MLIPKTVLGKLQLVDQPALSGDPLETYRQEEEKVRQIGVKWRRDYYQGDQYDADNAATMSELGSDAQRGRLPERYRLHAYSTDIQDALDFISGQLTENFAVEAVAKDVQAIIDTAMQSSRQLTGEGEADDIAMDDVLLDAAKAGDIAVELRWDPTGGETGEGTCFWDLWESECVRFDYDNAGNLERVIRTEIIYARLNDTEPETQITEHVVYDLVGSTVLMPNEEQEDVPATEVLVGQARRSVYWNQETDPRREELLPLSFIPWCLLRVSKPLRSGRGESLVSDQAMGHAARYDANEETSYRIARYNSHANMWVTGDAARVLMDQEGGVLEKDVENVMRFPSSTGVGSIALPTDPSMIEHQRKVLREAIWQSFGLARLDPETLSTIGQLSGYALEILNRKTEGTFGRIRRNWIRDMRQLINMTLDYTAQRQHAPVAEDGTAQFALVDVGGAFPKRDVEIRMGSGYIVDQVALQGEYTAGLLSRAFTLRKMGEDDADIAQNQAEIDEEMPAPTPIVVPGSNGALGGSQTAPQAGATLE